ncbi:MAG: biopolymer transporter ExbD [Pseudomonadota bacterium]
MATQYADAKSRNPNGYMADLNTTPLIDVMLVLLIMFIITIPPNMHAIKLDLPGVNTPPPEQEILQKNKIVLTSSDTILWNGAPVSVEALDSLLLNIGSASEGQAEVQFQPEATARYQQVNRILKSVKQANLTKFGIVGNEQYRAFAKAGL